MGLVALLFVYLFGGLTFLPLVLGLGIYLGTRAVHTDETRAVSAPGRNADDDDDGLTRPGDDTRATEAVRRELARQKKKEKKPRHDPADDIAASGYFAVYRTFVASGVDTRPVEPSTVGAEPVAPASPSVYQTFFRSMLPGKKGSGGSGAGGNSSSSSSGTGGGGSGGSSGGGAGDTGGSKAASPRPKNARNMFYVVLRHGYLILFDDDRQVDVRHVIKLADHDVGVYGGSGSGGSGRGIPEGELFIKRNAVRLVPKDRERVAAHNAPTPQPWFFYCENCSDKEDFYFALVRSQQGGPQPLAIDVEHLTALMQRLHASEEAAETRWLNALVGRLFLGVAKTPDLERFVEAKIATKLARMPRPGFVSSLAVQRVAVGASTPQITSPRLKSLSADGECVVEADVRYAGRFEVDLAATMRISMPPLGQQEVKTSLAVVLTHVDGHVLFKIKAPPSNRIWFAFRQMPKVEMEIRPIVMARQLTWPVVLTMIENKLKEAIADSIVLPFWDDTPFFKTDKKRWRGGLFEEGQGEGQGDVPGERARTRTDKKADEPISNTDGPAPGVPEGPAPPDPAAVAAATATTTATAATAATAEDGSSGKTTGTGADDNASPAVLRLRRLSKTHTSPATVGSDGSSDGPSRPALASTKSTQSHKKRSSGDGAGAGAGAGVSASASASPVPSSRRISHTNAALASPSEPTTGTDSVHAEAFIPPSSPPRDSGKVVGSAGSAGSVGAMAWLSSNAARRHSRSSASSDAELAAGTPPSREGPRRNRSSRTVASLGEDTEVPDEPTLFDISDEEEEEGEESGRSGRNGSRSGSRPTTASSLSARASSSSLPAGDTGSVARTTTIRRKPVEGSASTGTESSSTASLTTTTTNGSADRALNVPASTSTTPKRAAVLAAAVNDAAVSAAVSAKRWGITVLQQHRAAQAERRARTTGSTAPLDLSKPMGGGRPLPPVGEPLPLPRELAAAQYDGLGGTGDAANRRIQRKPVKEPAGAQQSSGHHEAPVPQPQPQPPTYRHRRRGSSQLLMETAPQQDLLVVAAPVDDDDDDDDEEGGVEAQEGSDGSSTSKAASDTPPKDTRPKTDDGTQWGELTESVVSAFLSENGEGRAETPGEKNLGTVKEATVV